MDNGAGKFAAGVIVGALLTGLLVFGTVSAAKDKCERSHNVYRCVYAGVTFVPTGPGQ